MKNSIVINSPEEIEKYEDDLEKIKIWVCSTACGKSYLCSIDDRFYDLDAYRSQLHDSGVENFDEETIPKMYEILDSRKIVLNASHGHFLKFLDDNNIPFVYMYGKSEVEEEYIGRMRRRGSDEEFAQRFGWLISAHYSNRANDNRATFKIEMNKGEFVSDYAWRVFGKPKKYIQFNNFPKDKYKIAFIDIDGTLVDREKNLSDFTIQTLKNLKDEIKIVLASARGFKRIKPFLEMLDLLDRDNYTLAFNGGLILNNAGETIFERFIKKKYLRLLWKYFDENKPDECGFYAFDETVKKKDIANFEDYIEKTPIYKAVCVDSAEKIRALRENMPKNLQEGLEISSSEDSRIEFVPKGITKKGGCLALLEFLGLTKDEMIAIGDGENDTEMFEIASCSVAMCNANETVKAQADFITDSNNDDGVAKALLRILGKEGV